MFPWPWSWPNPDELEETGENLLPSIIPDPDEDMIVGKNKEVLCAVCQEIIDIHNAYIVLPYAGNVHLDKERQCLEKAMTRKK